MSPVQVLVVLSTMIIINQAATLKFEDQTSVTASYDADKMAYELNKPYISNDNYSETTRPYYFNATDFLENIDYSKINVTDMFEYIDNSNETALPVLKSGWSNFFKTLGKTIGEKAVEKLAEKIFGNIFDTK